MTTETIAPPTAAREREAALRELSESEEQRTELRRELDTLRAQLREVTAERDAAQYLAGRRGADLDVLRAQICEVTAQRDELRPHLDCPSCGAPLFPATGRGFWDEEREEFAEHREPCRCDLCDWVWQEDEEATCACGARCVIDVDENRAWAREVME